MAFHGSYKDALIGLGAYDLSGVSNEASLALGMDELDSTVFGVTAKGRMAGLTDADFNLAAIFDPANSDAPLFGQIGVSPGDSSILTLGASRAEGARAFIARDCGYSYQLGAGIGELLTCSFSGKASKVLPGGYILEPGSTARTSSGNGTGVQVGAVGATQLAYATLHVFSITGSSVSLTVEIESDDNSGFTSAVSRITFTAATDGGGITSEWKSVAGAITDDYWRAKWTVTGTAQFKFIVGFGIR